MLRLRDSSPAPNLIQVAIASGLNSVNIFLATYGQFLLKNVSQKAGTLIIRGAKEPETSVTG